MGITAAIIIFQPELRRALEQLGRQNIVTRFLYTQTDYRLTNSAITDRTINEIVRACFEMGRDRTGALIVIERRVALGEYERTGISVDALLTSQLLINIFEHNTPLHDGAVIIRGKRIVCATCYLPLTDNLDVGKELGTRHRAALGLSQAGSGTYAPENQRGAGLHSEYWNFFQ
jgi:diadenylate cyclase